MGKSQLKQLKESLKERGLLGVKPSQRARIQKQQSTKNRPEQTNPYELKFSKTKHQVLNRKVKGVEGKPAAARKRATENRERDLLPEMKDRLKTGVFEDKRIGEKNPNMTIEDKMFDRFVQEQKRKQKGSMFNLEDDTLTHMGQSLSTIDDFNESDSDTSSHGGIQFSTVRHDHFGNFNDPSPSTPENTHLNGEKKTKAEVMKEVIAKSKHFKEARRVQREEDYEGGEALDEEFDEIRELLMAGNKRVDIQDDKSAGKDGKAYDMFVRELASEKRAAPSDRLKTDQEQAMEEKTKLEMLEKERLARMNGTSSAINDRQAQGDDLNEFMYANNHDRTIVEYNRDGELVAVRGDEIVLNEQGEMQESSEEDESSEEGESSKEGESSEEDESEKENKENRDQSEEIESEYIEEETAYFSCSDAGSEVTNMPDKSQAKELPFIFTAPQTYKDLCAYTNNTTPEELDTIITRIRVLHSVNLGGENRQKLLTLLSLLFKEYEMCTSSLICLKRVTVLQTHIFSLSLQFPAQATTNALARILTLQKSFKSNPVYCNSSDLMYLNLISVVFSVSDMRHSVVVPAVTYMCMTLGLVGIKDERDLVRGLFLCREVLRCVKVSQRFAPEVYNFLYRALRVLQTSETDEEMMLGAYPVHPQDKRMSLGNAEVTGAPMQMSALLAEAKADKTSRPALLVATYRMLFKYATHLQQSVSFIEQFEPLQKFLAHCPAVHLLFVDEIKLFNCQMGKAALLRRPLRMQTRKPVPIASYLPKFDEKFSLDRKSTDPNADRAAAAKLAYEHKREFKGAVRELKRDADFIATEKLRVIREKDGAYQKKIKGIMGQLATQEGAMRGYEREKKRGKR